MKQAAHQPRARPFLRPVVELFPDAPWLADYRQEIAQPMDLGTLGRNLESGIYGSDVSRALHDLELIWSNCEQFNGEQEQLTKTAKFMRKWFAKAMAVSKRNHLKSAKRHRATVGTDTRGPPVAKRVRELPKQKANTCDHAHLLQENEQLRHENDMLRKALIEADFARRDAIEQQQQCPEWWEVVRLQEMVTRIDQVGDVQGFGKVLSILARCPSIKPVLQQLDSEVDAERTIDLELLPAPLFNELQAYVSQRILRHERSQRARRRCTATKSGAGQKRRQALQKQQQLATAYSSWSSDSDLDSSSDSDSD